MFLQMRRVQMPGIAGHFLLGKVNEPLLFNALVQQYYIPGIQVGTKIKPHTDANSLEDAFSVERWVIPSCTISIFQMP